MLSIHSSFLLILAQHLVNIRIPISQYEKLLTLALWNRVNSEVFPAGENKLNKEVSKRETVRYNFNMSQLPDYLIFAGGKNERENKCYEKTR